MSVLKILIDTTNIKTSNELDRLSSNDPKESLEALIHLFEALKAGNKSGVADVGIAKNPVYASALVSITDVVSADDAISVNGVAFTAKASPSGQYQFQAHADPAVSGASLAAKINGTTNAKISSIVTAEAVSGEVTLTAEDPGVLGNGFQLLKSVGTNITVTDFADGTDGDGTDFSV